MVTKKKKKVESQLFIPQGDWYAVFESEDEIIAVPVAMWSASGGRVVGLCPDSSASLSSTEDEEGCIGYIKVGPEDDPYREALRWYQDRPGDEDEDEEDDEDESDTD